MWMKGHMEQGEYGEKTQGKRYREREGGRRLWGKGSVERGECGVGTQCRGTHRAGRIAGKGHVEHKGSCFGSSPDPDWDWSLELEPLLLPGPAKCSHAPGKERARAAVKVRWGGKQQRRTSVRRGKHWEQASGKWGTKGLGQAACHPPAAFPAPTFPAEVVRG